eukprot:6608743-Prymnesium_polylepis.1
MELPAAAEKEARGAARGAHNAAMVHRHAATIDENRIARVAGSRIKDGRGAQGYAPAVHVQQAPIRAGRADDRGAIYHRQDAAPNGHCAAIEVDCSRVDERRVDHRHAARFEEHSTSHFLSGGVSNG